MRTDTKKTMKIIDSCLSKEFVSIRQLSQYAEVSTKTVRKLLDSIINNDFNGSNFWPEALGEKYNEDIVEIQTRRSNEKFFRYKSSSISIFDDSLSYKVSRDLIPFIEYIESISGIDKFSEDITEVLKDVIENQGLGHLLNQNLKKCIRLDSKYIFSLNDDSQPLNDFLPIIRLAIAQQKVIKIQYQPFGKKPYSQHISPYIILEYNNRWFVIAKLNKHNNPPETERLEKINNYSFDRIKKVEILDDEVLFEQTKINIEKLLDHSYGPSITDWENVQYDKLVLKVKNNFIGYIKTKPIVDKILPKEKADKEHTYLTYDNFIITRELKQFVKSFSANIIVVEPKNLREEIIQEIKDTHQAYKIN